MRTLEHSFIAFLFILSTEAQAGDLGLAGALSGAGQGLGNALSTLQSGMIQQELMVERERLQRERERDSYERHQKRERDEQSRVVRERTQVLVYQELMQEKRRLDDQRVRLLGEVDTTARRAQMEEHNRQVADYSRRVADYERGAFGSLPESQRSLSVPSMNDQQRDLDGKRRKGDSKSSASISDSEEYARRQLDVRHPDWRVVVGPPDSDTAYRQWLSKQSDEYQQQINDSWDASVIAQSIDRFKEETALEARHALEEQRLREWRAADLQP